MVIPCELYVMSLCLLHMFWMLLANNISMLSAFIAISWFVVIFNEHFLFYYICSDPVLCAFIRFYSLILIGPCWFYVIDVIIRTNTFPLSYFSCGILYSVRLLHYDQYLLPLLVSTWLKAVTSSALARRGHVSLSFLTQISVPIQIT